MRYFCCFFFQAEDGIRDHCVTGVQTCSLFFSSRRRHTRSLCDEFRRVLFRSIEHLSDEQVQKIRRGGHDPEKVYAAYANAVRTKDRPTVILAKTIKGYGLGEAGEGRNVTHKDRKSVV